jgi:integrase
VDVNPARLVKPLSEKFSKHQAYVSYKDVQSILEQLLIWFRPIAQTAYYTGMRRGEILGLTWQKINLRKRIIYLGPDDVKEGQWKRVPIHKDLVVIFENIRMNQVVRFDKIFLHNGQAVDHRDQVRCAGKEKFPRLN